MSEIKKTCEKCKHCDCPPFIEPCSKCLSEAYNYQACKALWEPKGDLKDDNLERVAKLIHENGIYGFNIPIPSDTVLKTERDRKIDHINERVDDIQANILEYGNNCVSKLIELKEKVGLSPDADIYLKDIRQDLCDLDTKLDGLESMLKDIQKTLNKQPVVGDIHRVDEGPAKPEYDVGETVVDKDNVTWMIDKVVPSDYIDGLHYYDCHKLTDKSVTKKFQQHQIYRLGLKIPSEKELEEAHERLNKMTKKDPYENDKKKPKPKFKVGETVKYKTGHVSYVVSNVREIKTGYGFRYCYDLERTFAGCTKRNYITTGILESKLEEVK